MIVIRIGLSNEIDRKGREEGGGRPTEENYPSPFSETRKKDDAISYDNWCCEVDALMQRGHSPKKIKMAVLDALEGRSKRTAQVANTDRKGRIGRGKLYKILDVLENSYRRSVTYQSLIGELQHLSEARRNAQVLLRAVDDHSPVAT